jgi:CheY-like chemotaxis protein
MINTKTKNILIVDDDIALGSAMEKKFQDMNYTVTSCSSSKEALELLETEHFDVVLTDLHMPEHDGFDVLAKVRETQAEHVPAYVITNLGNDVVCDRAMGLGAKKCFIKSHVTLRDVVGVVDTELCS